MHEKIVGFELRGVLRVGTPRARADLRRRCDVQGTRQGPRGMRTTLRVVEGLKRENALHVWNTDSTQKSPTTSAPFAQQLRLHSKYDVLMASPRGAPSSLPQPSAQHLPPSRPPPSCATHSAAESPREPRSPMKAMAPLKPLTSPRQSWENKSGRACNADGSDEPGTKSARPPTRDIVVRRKVGPITSMSSKLLRGLSSAQLSHEWRWHLLDSGASPPPISDPFDRGARRRPFGAPTWRLKLAAMEQAAAAAGSSENPAMRMVLSARESPSLPMENASSHPPPPYSSRAAMQQPGESASSWPPSSRRSPPKASESLHAPRYPPLPLLPRILVGQRPLEGYGNAPVAKGAMRGGAAAADTPIGVSVSVAPEVTALAANTYQSTTAEQDGYTEAAGRLQRALDRASKEEIEEEEDETQEDARGAEAASKTAAKGPEVSSTHSSEKAGGHEALATTIEERSHAAEPWTEHDVEASATDAEPATAPAEPTSNGASKQPLPNIARSVPIFRRSPPAVSVQQDIAPKRRVVADNVQLTLTARPNVGIARGLETALEEAKKRAGPRPTEAFKKLVDAAASKLEETRDEIRRCGAMREARLGAFRACVALRDELRELFDLLTTDSAAGGPRRDDFFNLHLCLSREGFFGREKAGSLLVRYPYTYGTPIYVQYLEAGMGSHEVAKEMGGPAEAASSDLRTFGEGVQLWSKLLAAGGVARGVLSFEALVGIAFEFADAVLTHEHKANLKPFDGDVKVGVQSYLDQVQSMKNGIVHVPTRTPAVESPMPTPGRLRAGASPKGLRAAAMLAKDGQHPSQPTLTSGGGWKGLTSVLKAEGSGAFLDPLPPCLKHAWPHPEPHEMNRRWSLLKMGFARDGPISKAAMAHEFAEYCRLVSKGVSGRRGKDRLPLSYFDVDRAWRRMPDKNYTDLTFRHEVASRPPIAHGCTEVLNEATHADEEQTVCFIKLLDHDCDGHISERDLQESVRVEKLTEVIRRLSDKWHEAAVALES